ncbi:MAG: hypothetical protein HC822_27275 [Oscillochloris sp.]|nr:hypothetical protein [Oscillochloris sp.]
MNDLPGSPAAPPKRRGPLVRIAVGCSSLLLVACIGIAGLAFYENWQQEQNYNTGHAAYMQANCAVAAEPLRKAANGDPGTPGNDVALKAEAELQECELLLSAEESVAAGDPATALLGYSELLVKYADGPLSLPALGSAQSVSDNSAPEDLASPAFCQNFDTLLEQQILADDPTILAPVLMACGATFESANDFSSALVSYDRVRKEFPDYEPVAVQASLARAAIAEARALGAGGLPAPLAVGNSGAAGGQVTVVIQNDSPEALRLVFSGPEVRVEEIAACEECAKFENADPTGCPELGPVGSYVLAPGDYDVVVKAVSGNVNPFSGTWTLEAGQEYNSCFYIVTSDE